MTTVTTVKTTDAEKDLLNWLMWKTGLISHSAVLRRALLDLASAQRVPFDLLARVTVARRDAKPRACKSVVDKRTGRRDRQEAVASEAG